MNDTHARARLWTLCTPLAHASSTALTVVAAVLAAALVGAYVALAVLFTVAVLRVVRSRPDGHRSPSGERRRSLPAWGTIGPCRGRIAGSYWGTIVAPSDLTTWDHRWL